MKHLLDFQNIQKKEMENLIEEILKVDLLRINQIKSFTLLQFNENSTRTRLSFTIAAKRLGIHIVETTDNISAKSKGEEILVAAPAAALPIARLPLVDVARRARLFDA